MIWCNFRVFKFSLTANFEFECTPICWICLFSSYSPRNWKAYLGKPQKSSFFRNENCSFLFDLFLLAFVTNFLRKENQALFFSFEKVRYILCVNAVWNIFLSNGNALKKGADLINSRSSGGLEGTIKGCQKIVFTLSFKIFSNYFDAKIYPFKLYLIVRLTT